MRDATLPIEFQSLNGKVNYVQRVTAGEWSSSCPQCGGVPHKNGERPDRFRMWTNATGKNKVLGWCRHCSYIWFPDGERKMKPHEFEQWRKDALEAEERRKAEAEKAIALLKSEKLWLQFHGCLNDYAKSVITGWGIPEAWADYWRLGLLGDYVIRGQEGEYHTPAITIPVWQLGSQTPANIKLRTLNPKSEGDRYRNYYKTGRAGLFCSRPDLKSDTVLLVEGEKKAMVASSRLGKDWQVMGVPTKSPSPDTLTVLDGFGKIIVCLDPDAYIGADKAPVNRLINLLGRERCAVMKLPGKMDDLIVRNGLKIQSALQYARRLGG